MQIKRVVLMVATGCALGMLTGCGISEEDHNAMIAQMQTDRTKSEGKLNSKITALELAIKSEKAKVSTARIERDDAANRIKGLQQKNTDVATALTAEKKKSAELVGELGTSKTAIQAAQKQTAEAKSKYRVLDVEFQELERRFKMYQKNMNTVKKSPAKKPVSAARAPSSSKKAPKTNAEVAQDLLDAMGTL